MKILKPLLCLTLLTHSAFSRAKADDSLSSAISVTGECSQYVEPDRASITVTVENEDKDSEDAYEKTTATYEELVNAVKKQDFHELELVTTSTQMTKQFDWVNGKKNFRGHLAQIGLSITTSDTKKINQVFSITQKLKISETSALSFFISKELYRRTYDACLGQAVRHAKDKIKSLAEALDRKLGNAISIRESTITATPGLPSPMFGMNGMEAMSLKSAAAEISPPGLHAAKNEVRVVIIYQQSLQ
jgi:uncharacterized protein YggE